MMSPFLRTLALVCMAAVSAASARQATQTPPPGQTAEPAGPPPIQLSLADAIQTSLKNNLDIKVSGYTPQIRQEDVRAQDGAFDPNLGFSAFYQDSEEPSSNVFDVGTAGAVEAISSEVQVYRAGWFDPLTWGASYSANLNLTSITSTSANAVFPTTYQSSLEFVYNQSLLRNFGRDANRTQIVLAQTNHEISRSQFRQQVLDSLRATEDAYWELAFARQDLDVKRESLRLAEELLKLNRIKVQVGTLPPIEITTAEAEVANREQAVIVAENAVSDAEDSLRRVMNMPRDDAAWDRPIAPSDQPVYEERVIRLEQELETATGRRPDLEQARLELSNADTRLAFDRNQRKWDLNFQGVYTLQGLGGDISPNSVALFDPNGMQIGFVPADNQNFTDPLEHVRKFEFASWSAFVGLSIPIGNRTADARYVGSKIAREQADMTYQNRKLAAEVEVRTAARAILTNKKRIDAADKNIELQRKKVEAEQKKFENGMSTSFQVLEFQEDLTTALGTRNRALVDYRKSLTALELAKGTLDEYLKVAIQ